MFPMSNSRIKPELTDGSKNVSIIDLSDSTSTTEKNDSSTIGYLIKQSEILLKSNFSKYDIYIKYQEKLRLQLIKAKEDYKQLKEWLENANEDCFRMKSNDGHLTQIYKTLLKNNFINDFVEHGVARERLNLKFLRTMMKVEDLRKILSAADGDVTSVKSDLEELQYREVLLQITSTEESLKYAEFGKELRQKTSNVIHKCEPLSTCLNEACEEIIELKSKHDDLTRSYDVLLKNATIKEFLSYAKHRVELLPELPEKPNTKKIRIKQTENESSSVDDFSDKSYNLLHKNLPLILQDEMGEKFATNDQSTQTSSVEIHSAHSTSNTVIDFFAPCTSEMGFSELKETDSCENVAPINVRLKECEEELIAEKQRRELIEEKCKSLDKFSDKLCHLLLKYQQLMPNDKSKGEFTENIDSIQNSTPFPETSAAEAEMKEENNEELGLDEDELHFDAESILAISNSNTANESSSSIISKTNAPEVDRKNNEEMDARKNRFHFPISSFEKDKYLVVCVEKLNLDHYSKSYSDNYGSSAKKFNLAASNQTSSTADDSGDSIVKNRRSRSSRRAELRQTPISASTSRKRKRTENRLFYCKKCGKSFFLKKTQFKPKCPTCGARKNTIISKKTKLTINRPITRSNSVTANSAVSDFLCNICDRYYSTKSNLNVHKRLVHEGRKEFKCSLCGKLLKTKRSLEIHAATHSSLKPYQCPICIQCFSHPELLKRHLWKYHNRNKGVFGISSIIGSQVAELNNSTK